jgi:hypothetical protein
MHNHANPESGTFILMFMVPKNQSRKLFSKFINLKICVEPLLSYRTSS